MSLLSFEVQCTTVKPAARGWFLNNNLLKSALWLFGIWIELLHQTDNNICKPIVVNILTDLIFKLKMSPFSNILVQINSVSKVFLLLDLTIKFLSIKNRSFWTHIQEISNIFSNNLLLSISNHYMIYNLLDLQYCFCVSNIYSHRL